MCGHCGCQGVEAIGELRDEHAALTDEIHAIRCALTAGDHLAAARHLDRMVEHLGLHVAREEHGIFAALRVQGDFVDEVLALESEHLDLHTAVEALDPQQPDFPGRVRRLLDELEEHIEREDLGVFPASVVTLGATGWGTVERAHTHYPSFLAGRTR